MVDIVVEGLLRYGTIEKERRRKEQYASRYMDACLGSFLTVIEPCFSFDFTPCEEQRYIIYGFIRCL